MLPWLTRPVGTIRRDRQGSWWRTTGPPAAVLATAITYFAFGISGALEPALEWSVASLHTALVVAQSLALLFRRGAPVPVFATVVALHCVLLATTAAEVGIGSLAVMIGSYHLVRRAERPIAYRALVVMATVGSTVAFLAALLGGALPLAGVLGLVASRLVVEYLAPAVIAEFVLGRAQLAQAAREREHFAERERAHLLEQDRRAERTALARELHDIAGHHLSGIIVSAQAAGALIETDPPRSRSMLRELEQEARATMVDLRGTVGLLRSDDGPDPDGRSATVGIPELADLPALVGAARQGGRRVEYAVEGEPFRLGPIAEASAYRMVQESLANAARHAPGTSCTVSLEYLPECLVVTVENAPGAVPRVPRAAGGRPGERRGYGLTGMEERAELIGADLATGPTAEGGWRNALRVPRLARGPLR